MSAIIRRAIIRRAIIRRAIIRSVAVILGLSTAMSLSPASGQTSSSRAELEEVVVTATKRESKLQDVPISVGVVTGEFMDTFDIKDMSDAQNFIPGLQVQQTFGSWAVRIRGLGSGITNLAFDSSVPVYVDDVYCGRGKCMESAFLDMQRLEVARGPQGALFGKSTIAGAINAISARPTDEFSARIKVGTEFENGGYTASGYVTGSLSDSVRARLALKLSDLDGYTDNIALNRTDGDQEIHAARLGLDWDINDDSSLYLKFETGSSDTEGRNNQLVTAGALSSQTTDSNAEYVGDDRRSVSTGEPTEDFYDYSWNSATVRFDTEVAGHSLMAIAAHWEYENQWFLDVDGHPEAILNTTLEDEYDQQTLEFRVLSPAGETIEYIAGLWYQDSSLRTRQTSPFYPSFWRGALARLIAAGTVDPTDPGEVLAFTVPVGMDRNFSRDSSAYSVYGQVTFNINDQWRAIVDLRYTDEDQDGIGNAWPLTFPTRDTFAPTRVMKTTRGHSYEYLYYQNRSDDSLDPSVRVQYDINDDMMAYIAYAEGSKAGGLKANDGALGDQLWAMRLDTAFLQQYAGVQTIDEAALRNGLTLQQGNGIFDFENEEAESWEIGFKSTLADGAATLSVAAFNTEFTDLQTSNYNGTSFIIGNAGSATVNGFEVEMSWQVMGNLRLHSSLSWIDATYDDFADAQCVVDASGSPKNADCDRTVSRNPNNWTENQADEKLERSPDLEFNLNALWESQLTSGMLLQANISLYRSEEYFVQPTQAVYSTQDSFSKYDARVALLSTDDTWEVGLTGRNLGDEMTIQHAYVIAGNQFQSLSVGRTITLDFGYRF